MQFPPLPSWDAIHPLLIHFPIVLLLLSPLFVLIAAVVRPPGNRPYMTAALITLLLGTFSVFLAASSGEEAAELADRAGGVNAVLAAHEIAGIHLRDSLRDLLGAFCRPFHLAMGFRAAPEQDHFHRCASGVSGCLLSGTGVPRQHGSRRRTAGP